MLASPKKRVATCIGNLSTVNKEHVVMQTRDQWRCGDSPETVSLLFHFHFRSTPEVYPDLRGFRRFHTQLNSAAAINARIFGAPDVCSGGVEITGFLCTTNTC